MKPFDPVLKQQHETIIKSLNHLEICWQYRLKDQCQQLLLLLLKQIDEHHHQEWHQLFSRIEKDPALNQGGPFCTYFFDSFLSRRPQEKTLQIFSASQNPLIAQKPFIIPDAWKRPFESGSMITVPLEEHVALKVLVEALIEAIDDWKNLDQPWFSFCLNYVIDLAKMNFEKEETCLWTICQEGCHKLNTKKF